jgi:E3 ubiquitin-protein ligase listerin
MDRLRNELASTLMGISPSKASTVGLKALQMLCACAPEHDSEVVFMPQPRAVNAVKACQQWILAEGDDDEDEEEAGEEVESLMTLLFGHLAPILQNVPGQHWEFIFDVIENNLEVRAIDLPFNILFLLDADFDSRVRH